MDRVPASHSPAASPARRRWRGQGVVEFALILPVMLLVMFVLIELARLLHAWLAVENGARFGVRYAVTGEYDSALCVDSDASGTACDTIVERDNARLPSIVNAARAGSVAILRSASAAPATRGYFKVTTCSNRVGYTYWPSDSNTFTAASCTPLDDPGGPGDRVSVTVDFDHPLIVPVLSQWFPVLHLTAKREGIVEQFRVARVVGLPATIAIPTFTATVTSTVTETPIPSATATPTETGTVTPTMTPTATLDCSLITVDSVQLDMFGVGWFSFRINNGTGRTINLTGGSVDWFKYYGGQNFYGAYFSGVWYRWGPADPTPPSDATPGAPIAMASGSSQFWHSYFTGVGGGLVGDFSATLTFDGVCNVTGSTSVPTPTLTLTPRPIPPLWQRRMGIRTNPPSSPAAPQGQATQ